MPTMDIDISKLSKIDDLTELHVGDVVTTWSDKWKEYLVYTVLVTPKSEDEDTMILACDTKIHNLPVEEVIDTTPIEFPEIKTLDKKEYFGRLVLGIYMPPHPLYFVKRSCSNYTIDGTEVND